MGSANRSGLKEEDVHTLQQLMDLAANNLWLDIAAHLRDARDLLRKRIADARSQDLLDTITPD